MSSDATRARCRQMPVVRCHQVPDAARCQSPDTSCLMSPPPPGPSGGLGEVSRVPVLGPYAGRRRKYILCVSIKLVFTSPLLTPYLRKMECVSMVAFRSRVVSHFGIQVEYLRMFRIQIEQLKLMRKYHVRDICNSYFRCE